MSKFQHLFGGIASLLLIVGTSTAADDEPKGKLSSDPTDKPIYVTTADFYGQIMKVDGKSITIRETWTSRTRSGRSTRTTQQHTDHVLSFTPDGYARLKHLPNKLDDNGRKIGYTSEEMIKAKGNAALPGYQMELTDLKTGQHVEVHVVHITRQKENMVRRIMVVDEPAAPPLNKAPAGTGTANKNQ